jgi:hypothetical protein
MLPRLSVSTSRLRVAVADRGAATALWPTGADAVSTSPAQNAVATATALMAKGRLRSPLGIWDRDRFAADTTPTGAVLTPALRRA